jgi:hydroxymethylbilane synthase
LTVDEVVRIGTRGSQLARWQAQRIAGLIETRMGLDSEQVVIKTSGDRIRDVAFHKMEGKGFFTKELQDALTNGHVDLVVHSLKDLPTEEPDGLTVAAIPERANPADMLLAREALLQPTVADPLGLPAGAVLGTSSLRRAAQALALRPDLRIEALRGNVPTRVRKLREGQYDAILVAAAGVERLQLDLTNLDQLELPSELMLPAPAQGALAIETRADDPLTERLAEIHDPGVARCVSTERTLLQMLGGGCHLPLGCLAEENNSSIRLQAALGDIDDEISKAEISRVAAVAPDPEVAARTCREALRLALPEVVAP